MAIFEGTNGVDTITPNTVSGGVVVTPNGAFPSGADDEITGNQGADIINAAGGNDTMWWEIGDGDDDINGGSGTSDRLNYKGFGEAVTISALGNGDATLARDGETVTVDKVERLRLDMGLAGNDSVTINDLSETDVRKVDIDFGAFNAPGPDGDEDTLQLVGTNSRDVITISGDDSKVEIDGLGVTIRAKGIDGGEDAIIVKGFGGNDKIDASDLASDSMVLIAEGGDGDDDITGGDGGDQLVGDNGRDDLSGGKGGDIIAGGFKADTMRGGSGKDMFVVGNEVITGKADEILDFKSGKDSFGLVGEELTAALNGNVTSGEFREGLNAQDGNDHLIYHELTGRLFFDADGDGAGDKVLMAKLGAGTDLAFDDFQFIV